MTAAPSDLTFPLATRLDVGIDPAEDRLCVVLHTVEHGRRTLLLTRRLLRNLLAQVSRDMLRSSAAAARAPLDCREEVLRMEHVGALADPPAGPAAQAAAHAPAGEASPVWLALEVKITVRPDLLVLGFLGRPLIPAAAAGLEPVAALSLGRPDAHRVLALLVGKARDAGWDLCDGPSWLRPDEAPAAAAAVN